MSNKYEVDIQAFVKALQSGQDLTVKDGLLTPLIKQLTEAALGAEMDGHLAKDGQPGHKNGAAQKSIKTASGSFELGILNW